MHSLRLILESPRADQSVLADVAMPVNLSSASLLLLLSSLFSVQHSALSPCSLSRSPKPTERRPTRGASQGTSMHPSTAGPAIGHGAQNCHIGRTRIPPCATRLSPGPAPRSVLSSSALSPSRVAVRVHLRLHRSLVAPIPRSPELVLLLDGVSHNSLAGMLRPRCHPRHGETAGPIAVLPHFHIARLLACGRRARHRTFLGADFPC
ncbi:hypothetical protein A0H81_08978 [Grifola frondosa]|uniref:Uncharacterized protein n=1 Tax=Grifola frondosa TaxID=5627 RepID=A0A1C7M2J2_GRIFR|nr:hypothetical protein A0H81_08978 [Grifola frondosa]